MKSESSRWPSLAEGKEVGEGVGGGGEKTVVLKAEFNSSVPCFWHGLCFYLYTDCDCSGQTLQWIRINGTIITWMCCLKVAVWTVTIIWFSLVCGSHWIVYVNIYQIKTVSVNIWWHWCCKYICDVCNRLWTSVFVCVCVCVCVLHVCVCACVHASMCVFVCVCMYICTCTYACAYVHEYTCMFVCECVNVNMPANPMSSHTLSPWCPQYNDNNPWNIWEQLVMYSTFKLAIYIYASVTESSPVALWKQWPSHTTVSRTDIITGT